MQFRQITKLSRLQNVDLRAVKNLMDACRQQDGFEIKLYWNILQDRVTQELNDIFYFVNGHLVGYMALFVFEMDEAELSVMVHPKYRQRGLFKKLMKEGISEIKQRNISKCLYICPQGSVINKNYLAPLKPEYTFSQMEMRTANIPRFEGLPQVILQRATQSDLQLAAKIGAACFKTTYEQTLERFVDNMREKNRKMWLMSTPEHKHIGKIHIRYDENRTAFIHDLCILPEHRGKKYALAMVIKAMQMAQAEGQKMFALDVECDNENALKLYEKCGYKKRSAYDFWRVAVSNISG